VPDIADADIIRFQAAVVAAEIYLGYRKPETVIEDDD